MKTQVIVRKTLAVGFAIVAASAVIGACSGDNAETGQGGGSAQSSSSAATTGSVGGGAPDAGTNPLTAPCETICGYLAAITCEAWPNCSTECVEGFNAPADCDDEVKALIDCWATNKQMFECPMKQLIPPSTCQSLEAAFNECFNGSATGSTGSGVEMMCPSQIKNGTETTCAAKTECTDMATVFKSTCALPDGAQSWTCSCYKGDTLLGTCSAAKEMACENHTGCCAPFFFNGTQ